MAVAAAIGADFCAEAQGAEAGHDVDAAAELVAIIESRALFDIEAQQVALAVDFVIAQGAFVTDLHARHQLPCAHRHRGETYVEVGDGAAAGGAVVVDVERQFAALLFEAVEVEVADSETQARFESHAVDWGAIAECKRGAAEVAVGVALGGTEAATEVAFAVVIDVAGAGVGVEEQALFEAGETVAGADVEEGEVGIGFTTRASDAAFAVAKTAACAELFAEALGDADHQALAVFVAAFGVGRAIGAEVAGERGGPEAILADLEVSAAGKRRSGLFDHRVLPQQIAGGVGVHLAADLGFDTAEGAGVDGRLQVVVVGAVGAGQIGVLQLAKQFGAGSSVADQPGLTRQAVVFDQFAAQYIDGFLRQTEALFEVVVHAAVLRGDFVEAGLQVAGLHAEQRLVNGGHARRQRFESGGDSGGGVIVGREVVGHDGRIVDTGDALQHGGGPASAILAGGAVEQLRGVDAGEFIEQFAELAAHAGVTDESAVGLLHHGDGVDGAFEGDIGDVRAGRGGADDVDVLVGRTAQHCVGGRGDFAGGAQVVDGFDAEAVEGRQIAGRRRQRVGAVEHAAAHRAVVGRGVRGGDAGDVAEVVDALQARRVEQHRLGSVGGGDGQAQYGQRTQKTLKHSAASLFKRWAGHYG